MFASHIIHNRYHSIQSIILYLLQNYDNIENLNISHNTYVFYPLSNIFRSILHNKCFIHPLTVSHIVYNFSSKYVNVSYFQRTEVCKLFYFQNVHHELIFKMIYVIFKSNICSILKKDVCYHACEIFICDTYIFCETCVCEISPLSPMAKHTKKRRWIVILYIL